MYKYYIAQMESRHYLMLLELQKSCTCYSVVHSKVRIYAAVETCESPLGMDPSSLCNGFVILLILTSFSPFIQSLNVCPSPSTRYVFPLAITYPASQEFSGDRPSHSPPIHFLLYSYSGNHHVSIT